MIRMFKTKLKGAGRKALERAFRFFAGTGIGKVPGVKRIFCYLLRIFGGKLYVIIDNQKFSVPYTNSLFFSYYQNVYEPSVSSLFCSLIEKGMTVVDVGANLGYYTLLAAKRVGDNGLIIAFEPNPFMFDLLQENIRINGWKNVQAFQLAVSDSEGKRQFNLPKLNVAAASFTIWNENDVAESITVNAVSLDCFLQVDPDIIKIDVEGAELEVLRGMREILVKGKVKVMCEVHPAQLSSLGYSVKEIEEILNQYNYNIYLISEERLISTTSITDEYAHYLFTKEEMQLEE